MNIAIIFAGGTGQRMNTCTKPKQFLELHGKPILVYTLEKFQTCPEIDAIILVSLAGWLEYCEALAQKYNLNKIRAIISGGENGQQSIYNGLGKANELFPEGSIVLIHDGVRPLIDEQTITKNIACVKKKGSAITVVPATETIIVQSKMEKVSNLIDRSTCRMARAPQGFYLKDLLSAHQMAEKDGKFEFIDSASMMLYYGYNLFTIEGNYENIKITTQSDFYLFKAFLEANENLQIFSN